MVPESEVKAEGHRKSGHQLVDLAIAGSALFISLCSLGLAIHSGRAMDRLVEANSRPELVFENGNLDPERPRSDSPMTLYFAAENPGAGYARVEWVRLEVQGKEVRSWDEAVERAGAGVSQGATGLITNSTLSHNYVKPGGRLVLLAWPRTQENATRWDAVDQVRRSSGFQLSACYCSIFEQCWIVRSEPAVEWPSPVKSCAAGRPETKGPL